MAIRLDHRLVPTRDRFAAAQQLAGRLGVPWPESGAGPFCPVYLNDGLTLDFDQTGGDFPIQRYCFRVSPQEFDAILARIRAAGIGYRSTPHGTRDMQVDTRHGDSIAYRDQPDRPVWEQPAVSYSRLLPP